MPSRAEDASARDRAVTAADRNLVVTAGAGTGKTTLLVDRIVDLLLRQPTPLAVTEMVALTFTNKAANEMKVRLRDRLAAMRMLNLDRPPVDDERRPDWERMRDLCSRHGLSKGRLDELSGAALSDVEKSQIGTIHSFAAHLLRLYPIEARVDPAFHEDEGEGFREFFDGEWLTWLEMELGQRGEHHEIWRPVLKALSLEEVKALAVGLASELIPLDEVLASVDPQRSSQRLRDWFAGLAAGAARLREAYPKARTLEQMLDAAGTVLERAARAEPAGPDDAGADAAPLRRSIPPITRSWTSEDYDAAKRIVRLAQRMQRCCAGEQAPLLRILVPFVHACRQRFLERGLVSFDGLLARARDLLRDHPAIRCELKGRFKAVLVDEFQDTDPVQYELILYLAEAPGCEARTWREVRLERGKLFIVGDPKQSIYAFRRADMEAYDAVIEDHVLVSGQGGELETLRTNFRSHTGLLTPLNAFFERLFPGEPVRGEQPRYETLAPAKPDGHRAETERLEIRLVLPEDAEASAGEATRAEAEELARWLRDEVLGREQLYDRGERAVVRPKHIAVLLRTLTHARDYLDAFRRHDIPCLTEGEKYFYERQEIVDAVNLLLAIANPEDRLSVAAVLRSPLGAMTDAEIETLARGGGLDYRMVDRAMPGRDGTLREAFDSGAPTLRLLADLNRDILGLPLTEVMDAVFSRVPIRELAAASNDREQALANLLKLRDIAADLGARPDATLRKLIAELAVRTLDPPEEAESPLAEESGPERDTEGALRLMSIHKAKGLEFPLVVLAGLHRGTERMDSRVMVQHDWTSGLVGVRAGELETRSSLYVGARLADRRRAEQVRVLYVGMTRAQRRLVLSAGLPKTLGKDSLLSLVGKGLGTDIGGLTQSTRVQLGGASIPMEVVSGGRRRGREMPGERVWTDGDREVGDWADRWLERKRRREALGGRKLFVSPTTLSETAHEATPEHAPSWTTNRISDRLRNPAVLYGSSGEPSPKERALLLGTLAHRVLEHWDLAGTRDQLHKRIEALCSRSTEMINVNEFSELESEVKLILDKFFSSDAHHELRRATILGREVPFMVPWSFPVPQPSELSPGSCVLEGVIDLIYELDGQVWVADYKTDEVEEKDLTTRAESYRVQMKAYAEAAALCMGLERVGAKLVFLRLGSVAAL